MTTAIPLPVPDKRAGEFDLRPLLNGAVFGRAALVAAILGSVLTLANQPAAIFGQAAFRLLPLVLVYATPFVVVTISQVLGIRQAALEAQRDSARRPLEERFLATAVSHGIPLRAAMTGLLVGSANTTIILTAALVEHGGVGTLPIALLAQAYSLPILFGVLSQAISFRRAAKACAGQAFGADPEVEGRRHGRPPPTIATPLRGQATAIAGDPAPAPRARVGSQAT